MTTAERSFVAARMVAARRRTWLWIATMTVWVVLVVVLLVILLGAARREGRSGDLMVAVAVAMLVLGTVTHSVMEARSASTPLNRYLLLRRDHAEGRKAVAWGTIAEKLEDNVGYAFVIGETRVEVPREDFEARSAGDGVEVHRALHSQAVLALVPLDL